MKKKSNPFLLIIYVSILNLGVGTVANAQDEAASGSVQTLLKSAAPVIKESGGKVIVRTANLKTGQKVIFVRLVPEFDEYETISQGTVTKSTDKLSMVLLDQEKNQKYPKPGDYAVLLGEPKKFEDKKPVKGTEGFEADNEVLPESETGFAALSLSLNNGGIDSESSTRVNSFKKIKGFTYRGFRLIWFPEFSAKTGIEYSQYGGGVPVVDYFSNVQPSSLESTEIKFLYRSFLMEKKLQWKAGLNSMTNSFSTENSDEYVISSTATGIGATVGIDYLLAPYITSQTSTLFGRSQAVGLEYSLWPTLKVDDTSETKRGSSSPGSSATNLSVHYRHIFYWDFVPWFKRYFIELRHSTTTTKMTFSGPTKNSNQNFYVVPEGGTSSEKNDITTLVFGLMMEDWLGRALKPREK